MFCPNVNSKEYKDLAAVQGDATAHYLWNTYKGEVPEQFYKTKLGDKGTGSASEQRSRKWLEDRFPGLSVTLYNTVKQVGDETVHGYVENASMYLWRSAEVGTEYHEAYHLVFRTMLSEEQREGLYSEALAKFGEPAAAEIAKLKKQFPIDDAEARKLALEEKMAEEFREYVLTEEASGESLPGKIKSWFKNLWNWIKAMFSNSLGLQQTYSLIASNNMNKSLASRGVFRNSEKFKGYNTAYMQKAGFGDKMLSDTVDTIKMKILEAKSKFGKDFNINKAVGSGNNKGSVANEFLTKIYVKAGTTENLSVEQSIELVGLENTYLKEKTPEAKAALIAGLNKYGAKMAMGDNPTIRSVYKNIYNDWFTQIDPITENVIESGWRDMVASALQDSGYTLKGKVSGNYDLIEDDIPDEEKEALEAELEILDSSVEKIYGKSSLEDSPAKRLTGQVKELLSRVKREEPNLLGYYTYYNREEVYLQLLQLFNNKQSYTEMIAALENAVAFKPFLAPVLEFMNKLQAPQRAMMFNAFALTTTEFLLMKKRVSGKNVIVDIFNPNRKSAVESLVDKWKKGLITKLGANPRALYEEVDVTLENGSVVPQLNVVQSKVNHLQKLTKDLERKLLNSRDLKKLPDVTTEPGKIGVMAELLGEIAYELGLTPDNSASMQSTQASMQALLNAGFSTVDDTGRPVKYTNTRLAYKIGNDLRTFVQKLANFQEVGKPLTPEHSKVGTILNYNIKQDFMSSNRSNVYEFAQYYAPMINITGESFVAADGTQRYATNIQSHMNEVVTTLKEKGVTQAAKEAYDMYLADPFIGAKGNREFQSILFRFLLEDPSFSQEFKIEDFDAFKDSEFFDDVTAYEDMSKVDSFVIRLNAYINGHSKNGLTKIAIPVQADRNKYSFLTVPDVLGKKRALENTTKQELIRAQIVQDLLRVAKAKEDIREAEKTGDRTKIIVDYHESKGAFRDSENKLLGRAFDPTFFQFTAKDENGDQIVTDEVIGTDKLQDDNLERLSDRVTKFVDGKLTAEQAAEFNGTLNRMTDKMLTYFEGQANKVRKAISKDMHRVGFNTSDERTIKEFIEGFVITEAIMRNEIVKIFRGNRAMSKSLIDFYKRMGHLTTPGTKYALKGEVGRPGWRASEEYGMLRRYNEITLADLKLNMDQAQIDRTNAAAKALGDSLRKVANQEKDPIIRASKLQQADTIEKSYKSGAFDSTDAQAFISLEMYKSLQEGEGKWGEAEQKAYNAYKTTGIFAYQDGYVPKGFNAGDRVPVYPVKTYYERLESVNGTVAPISEKNSYSILLAEMTKDYPVLDDLRNRMEATGTYSGMEQIHVANFVSAKKLVKRSVYKVIGVSGEFANVQFNSNDSRGLRRPQSIPEVKDNPTITINRQIKKNMLSNVADDTTYLYNSGLDIESEVSGKDLKRIAHAAFEEKIRRDVRAVEDELKIPQLEAAINSGVREDIIQARLEILKTVRKLVQTDMLGSDMHSNYINALHIVFDEAGEPKFNIPLDLPVYGKKYESIVMSLLHNKVFKQSMSGFEAVQVAQLGGHAVDNELKFASIEEAGGKTRLIHAEIMIREDVARQFGIEPGQSLESVPEELRRVIGYRIPNQDKASVLMAKIVKFLPANYPKAVVVPGQLVKMMGSDFDVDKLNLLFPEVEKVTKTDDYPYTIRKVRPNYKALLESDNLEDALSNKSVFTKKALNNIIWDTFEAVGTNPAHFFESLTPLDDTTLRSEVERVYKQKPELAASQDWNDVDTETDMMIRNQAGNKLRGIYANAVAMRNVLMHGEVSMDVTYAPKIIKGGKEVIYNKLVKDSEEGIPTDKTMSLFLSAAVDAAKDAVQYELNDSVITAPIRILFANFIPEYDTHSCTNLLNQPAVRMFTDTLTNKYGGDLRRVEQAFEDTMKALVVESRAATAAKLKADPNKPVTGPSDVELAKKARNMGEKYNLILDGKRVYSMLEDELSNISSENRNWQEQMIMLSNARAFYSAGRKLMALGKRVTPDSMDGMGKIGNILAYKGRANTFDVGIDEAEEGGKSVMFYGPNGATNVTEQFIGKDSIYGLQRGYENMLTSGLSIASVLFPAKLSPAFITVKERLKELAGQTELTAETHQLIDGNLTLMLLMRKDSPLYNYFNAEHIQKTYLDSQTSIGIQLEAIKRKFPKVETNKFIAALQPDFDGAKFFGIKFDNSFGYSAIEKESFTTALRTLMFNPQVYLNRPDVEKAIGPDGRFLIPEVQEEVNILKGLASNVMLNTILTSGFRPGASSYAELIPHEFWTMDLRRKIVNDKFEEERSDISISKYLYDMRKELMNPEFFDQEDILTYMQLFGLAKAGGRPLLQRISVKDLPADAKQVSLKNSNKFVAVKNSTTNELSVGLNTEQKTSDGKNIFILLKSFFTNKTVYSLPGTTIDGQSMVSFVDMPMVDDFKPVVPYSDKNIDMCM